jgi:hypothetical protein
MPCMHAAAFPSDATNYTARPENVRPLWQPEFPLSLDRHKFSPELIDI